MNNLRITFLDRRQDHVRHSYPFPVSNAELDRLWLDKHTLTVNCVGYIITSENNEPQGENNPTHSTNNTLGEQK